MTIEIMDERFTVCKVESVPQELLDDRFCFVGKTDKELSLVCRTDLVPAQTLAREDGWRGMRVTGTLDFSLIGGGRGHLCDIHLRYGLCSGEGKHAGKSRGCLTCRRDRCDVCITVRMRIMQHQDRKCNL